MVLFLIIVAIVALIYGIVAISTPGVRRRGLLVASISSIVLWQAFVSIGNDQKVASPSSAAVPASKGPVIAAHQGTPGVVRVCLNDSDMAKPLSVSEQLVLPKTTVFHDEGALSGKVDDPSLWHYDVKEGVFDHAAIELLEDVIITKAAPCGRAKADMVTNSRWTATMAKAADKHVYSIDSVIDYPVPVKAPPYEMGKLIDNVAVLAVVESDIDQSRPQPALSESDDASKAAACLAGARKFATVTHAVIGTPTKWIVPLKNTPAHEASYGCAMAGSAVPDLFVAWEGSARPSNKLSLFIARGSEYLTGATRNEITTSLSTCIAEALKPDAVESSTSEIRGVKLECQAFVRDGGGGAVTIYRHYGKTPDQAAPTASEIEAAKASATEEAPATSPAVADAQPDASTFFIDHPVRLTLPFFGCPKQEGLDSVKAMLRAKDFEAMAKAAERGGCTALGRDTRGTVQDHSVWHASTCVRPRGEPDCLWVPDGAIAKAETP